MIKVYDGIILDDPFHITGTRCKVVKASDLKKKGHWILMKYSEKLKRSNAKCSECGAEFGWFLATNRYDFCPGCGASMEGDQDD